MTNCHEIEVMSCHKRVWIFLIKMASINNQTNLKLESNAHPIMVTIFVENVFNVSYIEVKENSRMHNITSELQQNIGMSWHINSDLT